MKAEIQWQWQQSLMDKKLVIDQLDFDIKSRDAQIDQVLGAAKNTSFLSKNKWLQEFRRDVATTDYRIQESEEELTRILNQKNHLEGVRQMNNSFLLNFLEENPSYQQFVPTLLNCPEILSPRTASVDRCLADVIYKPDSGPARRCEARLAVSCERDEMMMLTLLEDSQVVTKLNMNTAVCALVGGNLLSVRHRRAGAFSLQFSDWKTANIWIDLLDDVILRARTVSSPTSSDGDAREMAIAAAISQERF